MYLRPYRVVLLGWPDAIPASRGYTENRSFSPPTSLLCSSRIACAFTPNTMRTARGQFAHCHNSTFRPSSQDTKRYFLSASAKESHALSWISLIAPSSIKSHALSGHPAGFRP